MVDPFDTQISVPARIGARPDPHDLTRGTLDVVPDICHGGSVLATGLMMLADTTVGMRLEAEFPEWSFTTDFSLRVLRPISTGVIRAEAGRLRAGRTLVVEDVRFSDAAGDEVAFAEITFLRTPLRGDEVKLDIVDVQQRMATQELSALGGPLADVAGIEVVDAQRGAVQLLPRDAVRRPGGFVQGSIMTLLGEVSALARAEADMSGTWRVRSLDVRYVIGGRTGPLHTEAEWIGPPDAGRMLVRVRDAGHGDQVTTSHLVEVERAG